MNTTPLTAAEEAHYSRHLILPEVGPEGQAKLKAASVLLVGVGGLGSPAALYLAAAGVGHIGLIDMDRVDASNLHRQVLYGQQDVGELKVEQAAARLAMINPHIRLSTYQTRLGAGNARQLFEEYDVVVDGADNFATRYLVNDASVLTGTPNVHGSIFRFEGQVSIYGAPGGPCYRCLYPEPPPPNQVPGCAEAGVLGVLPGIVGTIQATEAIKYILGIGTPLVGRLLLFNALDMSFRTLNLPPDSGCPVCGDNRTIDSLQEYTGYCSLVDPEHSMEIDAATLKKRLDSGEDLFILDVRTRDEYHHSRIEGTVLIPLNEIPDRFDELDKDREIIVHCKSGMRSQSAIDWLVENQGFTNLKNLRGGILAWNALG